MFIKILLLLLTVFAIMAVQTPRLRTAVIYLAILSLISSFCYLIFSAPDVAISEAIIGSTLATILYLVALNKYKVFTIYYTNEVCTSTDDEYISADKFKILKLIEKYCLSKELEPEIIYTTEELDYIENNRQYDLIVRQNEDSISAYGHKENYHIDALQEYINKNGNRSVQCSIKKID